MVGAAAGDDGCLVDEEGGVRRVGNANGCNVKGGVVDARLGDVWEADIYAEWLLAVSRRTCGSRPS